MSVTTSITELRALQVADLLREIANQETLVVKLRMGVKMGMEKNSAKYVHERKQLARMQTVMTEKNQTTQTNQKIQKNENSSQSSGSSGSSVSKKRSRKKS